MNFVNTFVSNLEHLDQTAQTISKETDGDLKETIAKNLPFVTNKVIQEITARGFISGGGRNDDEDERKRRERKRWSNEGNKPRRRRKRTRKRS